MKPLNFIFAVGCFSFAIWTWVSGFHFQATMLWCIGVLYVKCGLDTRGEE